jgi:hypothetical protein
MRLWVLLLLGIAFPVHAQGLLEKILERLAEPAVIRAQFEQERTVPELARPSLSRGSIVVSRQDGVLWRVETPVKMTLAFTPSGIIQTGPDGVRRLQAERRGAVEAEIGRVMRGVLGADADSLQANFVAKAEGNLRQWTVRLAPRAREMARFLREIRLGGARHLESIEIEETSGNHTAIRMRRFAVAERLEPAELEQFKAP